MPEGLPMHVSCGFGAGFVATIVSSPFDVVKTRIMNRNLDSGKSVGKLIVKMVVSEGPKAFYKGFTTNLMRLGSWNIIIFVALE